MINLLIKVFNKLRLLKYFNLAGVSTINNKKFSIPVIKALGKENLNVSEQWMCKVLEKLLPLKKGVFVDIGVNTGQTLLKLKAVDLQRNYIGFEPNPNCVFYVQELIRINNFKNVTVFPVGLAEKTQLIELNFFTTAATDSFASIISDFRANSTVCRKEFIPCFKFSDLGLPAIDSISIIKIDVEGAELEVLNTLTQVIKEYRPFILVEILPVYEISNQNRLERQKQIEILFRGLQYQIYRIHKKGGIEIASLELISEVGIHSNLDWCEYILCPIESTNLITDIR